MRLTRILIFPLFLSASWISGPNSECIPKCPENSSETGGLGYTYLPTRAARLCSLSLSFSDTTNADFHWIHFGSLEDRIHKFLASWAHTASLLGKIYSDRGFVHGRGGLSQRRTQTDERNNLTPCFSRLTRISLKRFILSKCRRLPRGADSRAV
jgi:hypothetical protein